jgi:hypothetical protein
LDAKKSEFFRATRFQKIKRKINNDLFASKAARSADACRFQCKQANKQAGRKKAGRRAA